MFLQNGWTALHVAASGNNIDVVNLLLMKDPTLINQTSKVNNLCFLIGISHCCFICMWILCL